jgi:hypothetical protein
MVHADTAEFDPAQRLLIRALADPAHLDEYCRETGENLDWTQVFELAETQGVFPLLASRLEPVNQFLDQEVRTAIRNRFELHVRRSLVMTSELVRILQLLSSIKIEAIPFKGPALAVSLYGDVASRQYSDLDVLVKREHVAAAAAAMRDAGYSQVYPVKEEHQERFLDSNYELAFCSPAGILIELHWHIAPRHFSMALPAQELWAPLGTVVVGGIQAPALSPENLLLALSVHGAHHLWRKLAWMLDIHRLIATTPDLNFSQVIRKARGAGIERIVLLALALVQSVFRTPLPVNVQQAIAQDRAVAALTDEVRRELVFHEGSSDVQFHSFLLRVRERWQDRARYASRFVLTPTMQEWTTMRLPRRVHFLYSGMRVLRGVAKAGRMVYRSVRG